MEDNRANRAEKRDWLLDMGMMDSFEYFVGMHPSTPDDERTIGVWAYRASMAD